jgi:hypothetical protein
MCRRHGKQIRLRPAVFGQFANELERAMQDGRNDFAAMNMFELMKFSLLGDGFYRLPMRQNAAQWESQ